MNLSTTIPTTVQIRRGHLIGMLVAAAVLAAAVTWLLAAFAFDSDATPTTPAAVTGLGQGQWPGPPPYPPDFRGRP